MPYKSNSELPSGVKVLPERGQTIFRKAFNNAFEAQGEEIARKIAWTAVKKVFEKKGETWVEIRAERDYKKEYRDYHGKPEQRKNRAKRNQARRKMGLKKGDPREVDHKRPISKGGGNGDSNLRAVSRETNRKKGNKIQSYVSLYSTVQAFNQDDIINRIPANVMARIKEKDQHPFFQMYSIAHEGVSTPKVEGEEAKPITWTRKAIETMASVINNGVKFFLGHNKTNDDITQKEVGRVIHSFQEDIKGVLHQLVIGYFPNRKEVQSKDVCSQEATWTMIKKAGKVFAGVCKDITGIALESSDNQKPAFRDAKRIGMVQAFESPGNGEDKSPGNGHRKGENMTFQEMKQWIKDHNVHPSQVYTEDDIKRDREFSKPFDSLAAITKERDDLKKDFDALVEKMTGLERTNQLFTAKTRMLDLAKEKGTTEDIKKFLDASFEEDKETLQDFSDDALKKYINNETRSFQRAMKTVNPDSQDLKTGDDNAGRDDDDYTDPKNNEYLEDE